MYIIPISSALEEGIPHQAVTELRVCDSLLQLQRLQEFPDARMGAADQAFEPVVPSLCDVGASGKSEEGSIPLIPVPLVEERGS